MEEGLILNNKQLNNRKRRLQELLELNYIYPIHDRRLIHFLSLLDQQINNELEEQEVYQQYHQLKNLMKKYALTGNQTICEGLMLKSRFASENNLKLVELEKLFQQEMHVSIDEFMEQYMTRSDDQYERWGMTNVPFNEEIMKRYNLKNELEVRDTYYFTKDGEERHEVYHPTIISFITYLENSNVKKHAHEDYQIIQKISQEYHIKPTPQFDEIDFLSRHVGFKDRNELNAYFMAETDISIDRFMKEYVETGQLDHVSVWGMVQNKNRQVENTYKFIPTGNQKNILNTQTPLIDFVEQMRNKTEEIKPHVAKIQDFDITSYPENITKYFVNIPTFERHVNELLELQSYGFSYDEMKLYIYQKFLANDALLLQVDNYLELAQKDAWALIFLYQWQQQHLLEQQETNSEKVTSYQKENEKRKSLYLHN